MFFLKSIIAIRNIIFSLIPVGGANLSRESPDELNEQKSSDTATVLSAIREKRCVFTFSGNTLLIGIADILFQ